MQLATSALDLSHSCIVHSCVIWWFQCSAHRSTRGHSTILLLIVRRKIQILPIKRRSLLLLIMGHWLRDWILNRRIISMSIHDRCIHGRGSCSITPIPIRIMRAQSKFTQHRMRYLPHIQWHNNDKESTIIYHYMKWECVHETLAILPWLNSCTILSQCENLCVRSACFDIGGLCLCENIKIKALGCSRDAHVVYKMWFFTFVHRVFEHIVSRNVNLRGAGPDTHGSPVAMFPSEFIERYATTCVLSNAALSAFQQQTFSYCAIHKRSLPIMKRTFVKHIAPCTGNIQMRMEAFFTAEHKSWHHHGTRTWCNHKYSQNFSS